ncbi:MAG: alpha-ketoglutarate-dependent dioxygenase AlkB [Antricoccus sp.]
MDTLFPDDAVSRPARSIADGAVHVPGWLSMSQQAWIMAQYERWASGPVPPASAKVRGHEMSVRTVCLGWHWQPYKYTRKATDVNGRRVLDMPDWMVRMGRRALETVHDPGAQNYAPDTALVNFYDSSAKMGMHQDKDELSDAPVVSLSIGDSCRFRFGNNQSRKMPYQDLTLMSGDLFVFGGASRLAFHGVTKVLPETAPDGCGLQNGRINITLRMTGMDAAE